MEHAYLWEIISNYLDFDDLCHLISSSKFHYQFQYILYDKHYFNLNNLNDFPKEKSHLIKNVSNVANFELIKNFPNIKTIETYSKHPSINLDMSLFLITEITSINIYYAYDLEKLPRTLQNLSLEFKHAKISDNPL